MRSLKSALYDYIGMYGPVDADDLLDELAALQDDRARLDWLLSHALTIDVRDDQGEIGCIETRDDIDAAMRAGEDECES